MFILSFRASRKSPKAGRKLDMTAPRSPKHEPRRLQQQKAPQQQQQQQQGKKGWSGKTGRDFVDSATPASTSRGTSTVQDSGGKVEDGGTGFSSKAKGPNPALRKGPNDDLLL